ncbi:hypothetical protein M3Y99_01633800 [Aphelenchoides fujianensis]|nr:hypothetical protein M3Y99_01633800 [Aphelenchoides fujianensis]
MTSTVKRINQDIVQVEFPVKLVAGRQFGAEIVRPQSPKGVLLSVHHCIPEAVASYGNGELKIHVMDFGGHSSVRMKVKYHLQSSHTGGIYGEG